MDQAQAKAPVELKAVANFLRNKSGIKLRTGALGGKRVDYFKGKAAVKAVQSPAYAKLKQVPQPPPKTDDEAVELLHSLIPHTFYLRIERGPSVSGSGTPKLVQIVPQQMFAPDEYYVWLMDANPVRQLALAFAMVAVVLAAVMFPLWPAKMRVGVWYLSIAVLGLIGLFFAIAVVRLIVWLVTIVAVRPGIWIFPNLFADVGFVDSFIPLWAWDVPPPKKSKKSKKAKEGGKSSKKSAAAGTADEVSGDATAPAGGPKIVEIAEDEE